VIRVVLGAGLLTVASAFAPLGATADGPESQSLAGQKYEVASIKPCPAEALPPAGSGGRGAGPGNATTSPGRAHWECATLDELITTAYASGRDAALLNSVGRARPGEPKVVRGGPSWVYSDKFTVDAKATGDADRATLIGPMLRALLEDRFQLKTHRATEERSMYALTVAKGSLKIRQTTSADCTDDPERARAQEGPRPCGNLNMDWNGGNRKLTFTGTTLQDFARNVSSGVMDRYVADKTGLDGKFNLEFEFAPDDSTPGGLSALAWSRREGATPPTAPSIFTALEQQLGLKLEPVKAPAEYLVIDRVERLKPDVPDGRAAGFDRTVALLVQTVP
jgi:uncharacterized protein (TIGR03435 family)